MTVTQESLTCARRDLKSLLGTLPESSLAFIRSLPKVELHIHIEGTLTPELRFKLAKRNNVPLRMGTFQDSPVFETIEELKQAYANVQSRPSRPMTDEARSLTVNAPPSAFFEAFFSGFEVLRTREDFFDLAMGYFKRCADMNVRYCEVFFDAQGHLSRGLRWEDMMGGLGDAKQEAELKLDVQAAFVMCILRDRSPEDAMATYEAALPYRNLIVGIGLDSNEYQRPPSLFSDVFQRARDEGFKITAHCDVGQRNTHEHIRQVLVELGGHGADRVDHGLSATGKEDLVASIAHRGIGMTLCPYAYIRHLSIHEIAKAIRELRDSNIKIAIASDDPVYMDDYWILENMLIVKSVCEFTDYDMAMLAKDAVDGSWASEKVKTQLFQDIARVCNQFGVIVSPGCSC